LTEGAFGPSGQFGVEFFEAQADGRDSHTEIESDDAFVRDVEAPGTEGEIRAQSVSQAGCHFVGALALLAQQIERAPENRGGAPSFVHTAA